MITRLLEGWCVSRRGAGEGRAWCGMCDGRGVAARLAGGAWAHPRQLTLAPVVSLFLTLFCRLLLLLKGGIVGGDELILVCALVVMVAQHGLKQM